MFKIPVLLITCGCIFGGCQTSRADIDESIENEEAQLDNRVQPEIEEFNFGPNPGD